MEIKHSQGRRKFIKQSCLLLGGFNLYGCSGGSPETPSPPEPSTPTVPDTSLTILSHPVSQSVIVGDNAVFSVITDGSEAESYQWQRNGVDIPGAIRAQYTLNTITPNDDNASFRVIISTENDTITSLAATLSVLPVPIAPTITLEPVNASALIGSSVTFQVAVNSNSPFSYQWQLNGQDIPGATEVAYSLVPASLLENGNQYRVIITNPAGIVRSRAAILSVTSVGTTIDSTAILIDSTQITIDTV